MTDVYYMKKALLLAQKAKGMTSPNPMVGVVIVRGQRIIADGWHRRCGGDHAEVAALKRLNRSASGARLFVTLEPCHHFGRTPPCVDEIIKSGIKEVVIGMKDPNPLTNGKSILKLRRAGIKTKVGLLSEECAQLNEVFIKYTKKQMPFVTAKCAQSLDGKIATAQGESKWITSKTARLFARGLRDDYDAIMVGINTVLKDDPQLNGRKKTKRLKKIVLDSSLRIPEKSRLLSGLRSGECIVATTAKAPVRKIKVLKDMGVNVLICPLRDGKLDFKWLFKKLARQEITNILMEGGAHVIGRALSEKLVDKMHIYIAPKIFGDQKALSSVVGINTKSPVKAIALKKMTIMPIGGDLFITGYVKY